MLKQSLNQKFLQKLSPQQIQLMKLLQIPTATLDQRIKEELEANPALDEGEEEYEDGEDAFAKDKESEKENADNEEIERDDEYELDDYLTEYLEDDPSSYKLNANNYSADDEDKTVPIAVEDTFHEYLEQQLLIQRFDPPGIGSRNLQECLELQLRHRLETATDLCDEEERIIRITIRIVSEYFDEFSKKHYQKLQRQLNITEGQLRSCIEQVLKLNPKPASGHRSGNTRSSQYIVPDFTIVNRDGELDLTLNSRNAPDLRINEHYKDMLKSYKASRKSVRKNKQQKEAVLFIKQKIDSAKWFIDAIRQRQQTMYKTMYSIMQYQYDFFRTGDQKMLRPMILKDIADITGLDISTVSRVANSKFVQTEFGTKRLKDFFSESLQTSSGEEVSTLEVKKILTDIIDEENKRKPFSDEKLKNILREKGYNIARRTVAKYREQLNISVARLRKEL